MKAVVPQGLLYNVCSMTKIKRDKVIENNGKLGGSRFWELNSSVCDMNVVQLLSIQEATRDKELETWI